MKKISLALIILILVGICIPAVSSETIVINDVVIHSKESYYTDGPNYRGEPFDSEAPAGFLGNPYLVMNSSVKQPYSLVVVPVSLTLKDTSILSDNIPVIYRAKYTDTSAIVGTGDLYYYYDVDGVNSYFVYTFNDGWNKSAIIPHYGHDRVYVSLNQTRLNIRDIVIKTASQYTNSDLPTKDHPVIIYGNHQPTAGNRGIGEKMIFNTKTEYEATIITNQISDTEYSVAVAREYPSRLIIKSDKKSVPYYDDVGIDPIEYLLPVVDAPYTVSLYYQPHDKWYNRTVFQSHSVDPDDPGDPGDASVTVYIKNSQTGALIADANLVIDALVNGEYYPVTNRTEPSGIFRITLQPTGGGQPNPDGYRLIATADGYNNPMPEINFTVDDYKLSIYCLLDPIAGGPVNENKTFIDFFVRDMSSNPISGATVKFGKYTLITNSAGYTVFEVEKNKNYSWTVSKSGYGALTGNAVIGDAPRHTINTVLAPIVTPTTTTPRPTSPPIGPTPTMTAPTGEHVSNWLEWFAAHFGMILGGGVEIGKIFMWLCFTVPVGVYVGKEAKAGAAGFMAGAGIVTLFFVLIGGVPIWLVVLLALIIGLLYAKVFNEPDNGGGR